MSFNVRTLLSIIYSKTTPTTPEVVNSVDYSFTVQRKFGRGNYLFGGYVSFIHLHMPASPPTASNPAFSLQPAAPERGVPYLVIVGNSYKALVSLSEVPHHFH